MFGLEWKIVTDSIEAEKRHDAAYENRRGRDASDSSGKGVMQECRPSNHGKEAYKVRWAGSDVWGERSFDLLALKVSWELGGKKTTRKRQKQSTAAPRLAETVPLACLKMPNEGGVASCVLCCRSSRHLLRACMTFCIRASIKSVSVKLVFACDCWLHFAFGRELCLGESKNAL